MTRRLARNTREAILGGVAAGLGDYLDLDPVLVRLILILLCFAGGAGLVIYVICWIIMPRDDQEAGAGEPVPAERLADEVRAAGERVVTSFKRRASEPGRGRIIGGSILIAIGGLFLMDEMFGLDWLRFRYLWPMAVIVLGGVLFVQGMRGGPDGAVPPGPAGGERPPDHDRPVGHGGPGEAGSGHE